MKINPYRKGYRGEKELEATLRKYFPNYRIKRIGGTEKSRAFLTGDVFSPDGILKRFHWENKNRERLNVFKAYCKAKDDGEGKMVVLVWKRQYKKPLFIMDEDFLKLLVELDGYLKENANGHSKTSQQI